MGGNWNMLPIWVIIGNLVGVLNKNIVTSMNIKCVQGRKFNFAINFGGWPV